MPKSAKATTPRAPELTLTLAPDRSLIWEQGDSVRYLVADIGVTGELPTDAERPPLNLALAIDVSGSMNGEKLEAARRTAMAVAQGMSEHDRLTIVSFADEAMLHLAARSMNAAGRAEAVQAIGQMMTLGCTNLHAGWELAGETAARAMSEMPRATTRIVLLTDGMANVGIADPAVLARAAGAMQQRGILTSAVGIGDDYQEGLLSAMTEAGGGRLHDAANAQEISEVVLGELLEGRLALVERATLRVELGRGLKQCELLGSWAMTPGPDVIEVMVGSLRPDVPKRIVLRVTCDAGAPGTLIAFNASLRAERADGLGQVAVSAPEAYLRFVPEAENNAQVRDQDRSLAALMVWQSMVMGRAVQMNREAVPGAARRYLERELRYLKRYARGIAGSETLIAEVESLWERIDEWLDERVRKDVYMATMKRGRYEEDVRSAPRARVRDVLRRR